MRILKYLILIPLAAVLIAFAVANRHAADLALDPLGGAGGGLVLSLPLYWIVFAALAIGVLFGGVAVWLAGGRQRSAARRYRREAERLRLQLERAGAERSRASDRPAPTTSPRPPQTALPPAEARRSA